MTGRRAVRRAGDGAVVLVGSAEDPLADFLASGPTRRGRGRPRRAAGGVVEAEARRRLESGDWRGARPGVLVAAHGLFHRGVYGIPDPAVATAEGFRKATFVASSALRREPFSGDVVRLADFLRWVWIREGEREEWAARKGVARHTRLSVWRAFSAEAVGDWLLAARRAVPKAG